ncbi:unnamed protein product [Absidia cylindrospora]
MTGLGNLPTELLSLILEYVDNCDRKSCALLNKRFHAVTNPFLWRALRLFNYRKYIKVRSIIKHSKYTLGQHVRTLLLFVPFKHCALLPFLNHLPLLEILGLPGTSEGNIPDTIFRHVPRLCPHLKTLFVSKINFGQDTLEALARHCYQLKNISLLNRCPLPANTFRLLAANCPLERITVEMSDMIDLQHTSADAVALDLTRFDRLTELCLFSPPLHFTRRLITVASSNVVWPHLTSLELDGDLHDSHIVPFIKTHRNLQVLGFKNATSITDATLDAIATYLPTTITDLTCKYSRKLTGPGVHRLVRRCSSSLACVGLKGCRIKATPFLDALGDDYVKRMENYSENYDHVSYLHTLDQHALDNLRQLDPLTTTMDDNNDDDSDYDTNDEETDSDA